MARSGAGRGVSKPAAPRAPPGGGLGKHRLMKVPRKSSPAAALAVAIWASMESVWLKPDTWSKGSVAKANQNLRSIIVVSPSRLRRIYPVSRIYEQPRNDADKADACRNIKCDFPAIAGGKKRCQRGGCR